MSPVTRPHAEPKGESAEEAADGQVDLLAGAEPAPRSRAGALKGQNPEGCGELFVGGGNEGIEAFAAAVQSNRERLEASVEAQKAMQPLAVKNARSLAVQEQEAEKKKWEAVHKANEAKGGGFWKKLRSMFTQEIQRAQAAAKRAQAQLELARAAVQRANADEQRLAKQSYQLQSTSKDAINKQKKYFDAHGEAVSDLDKARAAVAAMGTKVE